MSDGRQFSKRVTGSPGGMGRGEQVLRLRIWSEDGGSLFTELKVEAQVMQICSLPHVVGGVCKNKYFQLRCRSDRTCMLFVVIDIV